MKDKLVSVENRALDYNICTCGVCDVVRVKYIIIHIGGICCDIIIVVLTKKKLEKKIINKSVSDSL